MFLIRLDSVSLAFGARIILREADFSIEPGERVCLIGRNGAGKTSLLRLVTGEQDPDEGEVQSVGEICISELTQVLPEDEGRVVGEFVSEGLSDIITLTDQYRMQSESVSDANGLKALQELQTHIEAHGGWHPQQQVQAICTEMELDAEQPMAALSGGWRRRAALARALIAKPDLLLLDEPTNHLDFATIAWLENRISAFSGAVLFITHDRAFLQRLATRIVEIDRGKLKIKELRRVARVMRGEFARLKACVKNALSGLILMHERESILKKLRIRVEKYLILKISPLATTTTC